MFLGRNGDDCSEGPGPQPPEMQIGHPISIALDRLPDLIRHARVRVAVQQDATCVPQQAERPVRNNDRADQTGERIHPKPSEGSREKKSDDHQHRNCGIGRDMDDRSPHIVISMMGTPRRFVSVLFKALFEFLELIVMLHTKLDHELMRFGNLLERLQISLAISECECLPAASRSYGFNGDVRNMQLQTIQKLQSETRRHTVFKNL